MAVFVDSGILLRAIHRADPHYAEVRAAARELISRKTALFTGLQHLAEFWNVCTRPPGERGGFDLPVEEVQQRLDRVRRGVTLVTETPLTPSIWKGLVCKYRVKGVQVHDARTIALMLTHSVFELLTLNKQDFVRYRDEGIIAWTPAELCAALQASSR